MKTKDDIIQEKIFNSLMLKWDLSSDDIIDGISLEKKEKVIEECSLQLIDDLKKCKINNMVFIKKDPNTIKEIISLFPIALVELEPADFEGSDYLYIEELFKNTAAFI